MANQTPAVSVIIPAFNVEALIGKALEGLARQDFKDRFEVVVVDDGSDDETIRVALESDLAPSVVRLEHEGPGPARNAGAREAKGRAMAFLDADCVPEPEWLREGLAALSEADFVQGRVLPERTEMGPFDRTLWVTRLSPLFESANLFVSRELFEHLGGFEDWLQIRRGKPLAEDVWFGWRARRAGARIAFSERALVKHAVFERGPRGYVSERLRVRYFPAMVAKIPELRSSFLFARLFLTPHSARTDAAATGLALAALTRSRRPLALCVPYLAWLGRRSRPHRRNAPLVMATEVIADLAGLLALVAGSLRRRTPVL